MGVVRRVWPTKQHMPYGTLSLWEQGKYGDGVVFCSTCGAGLCACPDMRYSIYCFPPLLPRNTVTSCNKKSRAHKRVVHVFLPFRRECSCLASCTFAGSISSIVLCFFMFIFLLLPLFPCYFLAPFGVRGLLLRLTGPDVFAKKKSTRPPSGLKKENYLQQLGRMLGQKEQMVT